MTGGLALVLTIAAPVGGALLIGLLDRHPNWRECTTLATAGALFLLVASQVSSVMAGDRPSTVLAEPLPGLPLALTLEPLGLLFSLVASFLWIVTSIYSIGYMRGHGESHQTRFYVFFALSLSSAMGVAFAGNMFTLFIFYELLTLCTYPLVTHAGTLEAKRAGRLYLGFLLSTSIGLQLLAMIWTWDIAGTLSFAPGGILADKASPRILSVLFVLYVLGVGKAALMPFHRWLPAAMVAPTPVSALLHAVAVVKAGVFTILKISVYLFGLDLLVTLEARDWLMALAAATILIASAIALTQDNLKARLAYSTISQLSYVVLGGLLANTWSLLGAGMHIAMHAFGKITLFFCAGAILVAAHKTEISQLDGIGRRMPITMAAFFIGSLSVIGLPPTGGSWSKWFLALGTVEAAQYQLLAVLMLSTLLNVAYLMPIPIRAFFSHSPHGESFSHTTEAPLPCLIALVLSAGGCLALFLQPDTIFTLLGPILPTGR